MLSDTCRSAVVAPYKHPLTCQINEYIACTYAAMLPIFLAILLMTMLSNEILGFE